MKIKTHLNISTIPQIFYDYLYLQHAFDFLSTIFICLVSFMSLSPVRSVWSMISSSKSRTKMDINLYYCIITSIKIH